MNKIIMIMLAVCLSLPVLAFAEDQSEDQSTNVSVSQPQSQPQPQQPEPAEQSVESPESSLNAKKIEENTQQLSSLQRKLDQIQQQMDLANHQISIMQYTIYGLGAIILLLAFISLAQRRKSISPSQEIIKNSENEAQLDKKLDDTRGEYDFMGSTEGIPAKLDLARAYIAMEDYNAARETLNEILEEGNEEHQQEARSLLNKI